MWNREDICKRTDAFVEKEKEIEGKTVKKIITTYERGRCQMRCENNQMS